jgi:cold shock CspA family protein
MIVFQVEFTLMQGHRTAMHVNLIERHRIRGWIAIIREGKGFIEQDATTGNVEPVPFLMSSFTGDNTQIELGDEVEFSLRKSSGRLVAENILKVASTIQNFYVSSFDE